MGSPTITPVSLLNASNGLRKPHVRVFKALEPYINVWDHGVLATCEEKQPDGTYKLLWKKPVHVIDKWDWRRDDKKQLARAKFSASRIKWAWVNDRQLYYTSGRQGKALQYVDLDDHEAYQRDKDRLHEVLLGLMGKYLFIDPHGRFYLKINYGAQIDQANELMKALAKALFAYTKGLGINSDVDLAKGTIAPMRAHGVLARLPALKTAADVAAFQAAPEVSLDWIRGLVGTLEEKADWLKANKVVALNTTGLAYTTDADLDRLDTAAAQKAEKKAMRKRCGLVSGSVTGFVLNREEMDLLPAIYKDFKNRSFYLYAMTPTIKTTTRAKVTAKDYQAALLVMSTMKHRPNPDRSAPTARAQAIWEAFHEAGVVERAWNPNRWAVMRNTMADLDWLECFDSRYRWVEGGKGQAMKWELREQYAARFEEDGEERTILNITPTSYVPCRWRPKCLNEDCVPIDCLPLIARLQTKRKLYELNAG